MADHGTAIQWTHIPGYKGETWNPVTGCDRVSPGCAHCYALDLAAKLKSWGQPRYQKDGDPKTSGPGFGVTLHPDRLEEPLGWKKPRGVFVNSMSDLFHEAIPEHYIFDVFEVMARSPQHIFMVLTKRPDRMVEILNTEGHPTFCEMLASHGNGGSTDLLPPNIWLGVTIENRRFVDRADLLRKAPAAVRFISAEPLLGPLLPDADFMEDREEHYPLGDAPWHAWRPWADGYDGPGLNLEEIDWLIAGGESGPGHRPIKQEWVEELQDYCAEECWQGEREGTTAFFLKQWGGPKPTSNGRLLNGRAYDEFPAVVA